MTDDSFRRMTVDDYTILSRCLAISMSVRSCISNLRMNETFDEDSHVKVMR